MRRPKINAINIVLSYNYLGWGTCCCDQFKVVVFSELTFHDVEVCQKSSHIM